MANFTKSWQMEVGLNHVPAYQVSGQPFASGSINAIATATATKISFPYVTRWIYVTNNSASLEQTTLQSVRVSPLSRSQLNDLNLKSLSFGLPAQATLTSWLD